MKGDPRARSSEHNLRNCVKKPEKLKQLVSNFFLCGLCVPNILAKVAGQISTENGTVEHKRLWQKQCEIFRSQNITTIANVRSLTNIFFLLIKCLKQKKLKN